MTALLAATSFSTWPFVVLAVCVFAVIVMISRFRIHPFLALIFAALLAGVMAEKLPGARPRGVSAAEVILDPATGRVLKNHWARAVELTTEEFGKTAGGIGIVIGLAAIIGMCLMESGAADRVVRRALSVFGQKRAGIAIVVSSYVLSIPIFFDTMFMLMVPLAMALALRTGRDYMLYVMAICCGAVVTHSLTVPHPGPLAAVENLKLDVGFSILAGIVVGILPAVVGWWVAKWINRATPVPLRETVGMPLADLQRIVDKPEHELPPFGLSILPVVLPVILISLASLFDVAQRSYGAGGWAVTFTNLLGGRESVASIGAAMEFIGNKTIALMVGTVISVYILARQKGLRMSSVGNLLESPLYTAGVIILITSAGGAFGLMLRNAGVGDAIRDAAAGRDINLIWLAYAVAVVLRVAQGSATVAMLTTSAMLYPMISDGALPFDPIYIFLAIAFGSFAASWMNDSGFWVVSKLSGFTEKETLRSWTVLLTAMSLTGLLTTWLLSLIIPWPVGIPMVR